MLGAVLGDMLGAVLEAVLGAVLGAMLGAVLGDMLGAVLGAVLGSVPPRDGGSGAVPVLLHRAEQRWQWEHGVPGVLLCGTFVPPINTLRVVCSLGAKCRSEIEFVCN